MRRPEWLAERGGTVEFLRLPAVVFGAVAGLRGRLYDAGVLPAAKLAVPVVSVGNLSTGGTGKTPCVALVCRALAARGRRPGILSRGYGAREGETNDEARLLAAALPDVPHVADPDRVRGAERLLTSSGCDVIVLDDGFQHRRLWRDLDLVLVDASRPWGLPAPQGGGAHVRAVLPRGLLREAPRALSRAHALVLTRVDQVDAADLASLRAELEHWAPGVPQVCARHAPSGLRVLENARVAGAAGALSEDLPQPEDLAGLVGRDVDLVSGIGNPEAFARTVREVGANPCEVRALPDHHDFQRQDLDGLGTAGRLVLTTEKDAAKLERLGPLPMAIAALGIELSLVEGAGVFAALLDALRPGAKERERRSVHEGLHG